MPSVGTLILAVCNPCDDKVRNVNLCARDRRKGCSVNGNFCARDRGGDAARDQQIVDNPSDGSYVRKLTSSAMLSVLTLIFSMGCISLFV